ncbi:MAG: hypothetical protein ACLTDF_08040 [Coprococcus sp.]
MLGGDKAGQISDIFDGQGNTVLVRLDGRQDMVKAIGGCLIVYASFIGHAIGQLHGAW